MRPFFVFLTATLFLGACDIEAKVDAKADEFKEDLAASQPYITEDGTKLCTGDGNCLDLVSLIGMMFRQQDDGSDVQPAPCVTDDECAVGSTCAPLDGGGTACVKIDENSQDYVYCEDSADCKDGLCVVPFGMDKAICSSGKPIAAVCPFEVIGDRRYYWQSANGTIVELQSFYYAESCQLQLRKADDPGNKNWLYTFWQQDGQIRGMLIAGGVKLAVHAMGPALIVVEEKPPGPTYSFYADPL